MFDFIRKKPQIEQKIVPCRSIEIMNSVENFLLSLVVCTFLTDKNTFRGDNDDKNIFSS